MFRVVATSEFLFFSLLFLFLCLLFLCPRQRTDGNESKVANMLHFLRSVEGLLIAEEHLGAYGQGEGWKNCDESVSWTLRQVWSRKEEHKHVGTSFWFAYS
jgi:hypothetical protein